MPADAQIVAKPPAVLTDGGFAFSPVPWFFENSWIRPPHCFGNETAIDEMLSKTALWTEIDFENRASDRGESQKNIVLS
jgi:hypothetical protein